MPSIDRFDSQQLLVPRILWGAFVVSQLSFAFVGWMVTSTPEFVGVEATPVVYAILGIAVLIPLLAPLIVPLLIKSMRAQATNNGQPSNPLALVMTPFIIDLALREAGGVMALTILFMTGDFTLWSIPATVALAMTILALPSSKRLEGWL